MARLYEYQGKQLLEKAGFRVPQGRVADTVAGSCANRKRVGQSGCGQSPNLGHGPRWGGGCSFRQGCG